MRHFFFALLGVASHFNGAHATELSFGAEYDGTNFLATGHTEGNEFKIRAKASDIVITRFDVNIGSPNPSVTGTTDTIVVKTQPGSYISYNDAGWTVAGSFADIVGQGKNEVTPLPAFDTPIVVTAGSTQSFWVSTTPAYDPMNIYYSSGDTLNAVYASNDDLEIMEGHYVGSYSNGSNYLQGSSIKWNGIIHYTISAGERGR